ncbi:hypothetical protein AN958_05839 [Leucoagaricus sp. SymC.cos]|nr:hypothetical protein AN958_05839 [Leucoagaricus sp. SymC.cos]
MMEYIVVHTRGELEWYVTHLEADALSAEPDQRRLGDWTTRIDFCISGDYDSNWMLRLLTCTPNLLIYTMNTGRSERPEHSMNQVILGGLVQFHSTLKRLDWAGVNDAPTYEDLLFIAKSLRSLTTLHLRHLYSLPLPHTRNPMLVFPSLKSLSLGLTPLDAPLDVPEDQYHIHWDVFLMYLIARPFQLSKLERFEIEVCPVSDFFAVYGRKIRTFRTSSWSSQDCMDDAFKLLPNLETFLYTYHTAPECHIPLYHPKLKKMAVLPRIEEYVEVPESTYQFCIIKPLDNLLANVEDMDAKNLADVRICDRGAFTGVFESDDCLFWHWRRRLQDYKSITLQNKSGDLDIKYAKCEHLPPIIC